MRISDWSSDVCSSALAGLLVAMLPGEKRVRTEALADTALTALPLQTEIWLENQRKALPAPAVTLVDSIGVKLEALAPQLERLGEQAPAAQDIRNLLADHLPELVTGYRSIPEPLRREIGGAHVGTPVTNAPLV